MIKEWGSLEVSVENAERVSNKRTREALLKHAEQARLSKELVQLDTNVPLEVKPEELRYRGADRKAAFELFERLGFTSLLNDYLPEAASAPRGSYLPIATPTELKRLLESARRRGRLALSLGTGDGDAEERLLGLGLAVEPGTRSY